MIKRILAALAAPLALGGALALGAGAANASPVPTTVTAVTHVQNRADSGANGNWAYDDYARTLTVTDSNTACQGIESFSSETDNCYTATISDVGQFHAIVGAFTPNQSHLGLKVERGVSGSMNGGASYTLYAPKSDTLTGTVKAFENDHFGAPSSGDTTTSDWPAQTFSSPSGVTLAYDNAGNDWSWTYKTGCESWTDSGVNGDGNLAADGNITGRLCAPRVKLITVGNYIGRTDEAYAEGLARANGLTPAISADSGNPVGNLGKITAQTPAPGTHVRPGSVITFTYTDTPGLVPNVIGRRDLDTAEGYLRASGFVPVAIGASGVGNLGSVTAESPAPGLVVTPGSDVTITYTIG
jgi:hypothetical protein